MRFSFSLNRRLVTWWIIAVIVVVVTHYVVNYMGLTQLGRGLAEAVVLASLLLVPFFLIRRRVVQPLSEMRETAYKIIAGDLSARARVTEPVEFRELAETINAMVTKLDYTYRQLLEANIGLEKTVRERTRELTIEHEKLSAIFNNIPDGVIFLSMSGEIIEVNPVMSKIWGIDADQLKGKKLAELPEGPIKEALIFVYAGATGGKRCWEMFNCVEKNCPAYMSDDVRCWLISGTYCHNKDIQFDPTRKLEEVCSKCVLYKDVMEKYGHPVELEISGRHYKVTSSVVLDESHKSVIGEIKTFYDITEEKLLERRKADFISLITHDLKSPLTSILGYSDLMLTMTPEKLDQEEKEYLNSIKANGGRLLDMVEQYLDLTKMEAGMLELNLTRVDPEWLLNESVSALAVQAMEKNISLHVETPDGLLFFEADKDKMLRVVTNMVSNAVKYTMSGGKVMVSARASEMAGQDAVEISVEDNGYGIQTEDLPHIFDRYYRSKSISGVRGTGLGLAVVKSLVDMHGGEVSVESALGKGSRFTVKVPVKRAA